MKNYKTDNKKHSQVNDPNPYPDFEQSWLMETPMPSGESYALPACGLVVEKNPTGPSGTVKFYDDEYPILSTVRK